MPRWYRWEPNNTVSVNGLAPMNDSLESHHAPPPPPTPSAADHLLQHTSSRPESTWGARFPERENYRSNSINIYKGLY